MILGNESEVASERVLRKVENGKGKKEKSNPVVSRSYKMIVTLTAGVAGLETGTCLENARFSAMSSIPSGSFSA